MSLRTEDIFVFLGSLQNQKKIMAIRTEDLFFSLLFLRRYRPQKIPFWHVSSCNDHYQRLQFVHANAICYVINSYQFELMLPGM